MFPSPRSVTTTTKSTASNGEVANWDPRPARGSPSKRELLPRYSLFSTSSPLLFLISPYLSLRVLTIILGGEVKTKGSCSLIDGEIRNKNSHQFLYFFSLSPLTTLRNFSSHHSGVRCIFLFYLIYIYFYFFYCCQIHLVGDRNEGRGKGAQPCAKFKKAQRAVY